jgi:hypothetical protein
MKVEFFYPPQYLFERDAVQVDATVDGEMISCVVTEDLLYRFTGNPHPAGAEAAMEAFNRHREAIEYLIRDLLERQGVPAVNEAGRRELLITLPPTDEPGGP